MKLSFNFTHWLEFVSKLHGGGNKTYKIYIFCVQLVKLFGFEQLNLMYRRQFLLNTL